ncbi:MAG: heme-binding protein [Pikeienuella sp.]
MRHERTRRFSDHERRGFKTECRHIGRAEPGDPKLGPLADLPGTWTNHAHGAGIDFHGFGWNLIALPFEPAPDKYRVLMNQYNEALVFKTADKGVPNRGLDGSGSPTEGDQTLAALDYEQTVAQIADADQPHNIGDDSKPKARGIHHEPGLFLYVMDERTAGLDIARLGVVPHGNSVLAMGRASEIEGAPVFPDFSAEPIGPPSGVSFDTPPACGAPDYLAPYRHFIDNPFMGANTEPGFPGFDPRDVVNLLRINPVVPKIQRSTVLDFDTTHGDGGIVNTPFIEAQADAAHMRSIFWIHELDECEPDGQPMRVMQYLQIVMLEFFPRRDGEPGLARWPHVSINTMKWVSAEPQAAEDMPNV